MAPRGTVGAPGRARVLRTPEAGRGPGGGSAAGSLLRELERPLRAPVDRDGPAHIGRWHRVASGLHRHQTIGRDLPRQHGGEGVRGMAVMGTPRCLQTRLRRCADDGAMETLIRPRHHPLLCPGVQGVPAGTRPPHYDPALDGLAARCHLAFRLRPIGPTHARREAILVGAIPARRRPREHVPVPIPLPPHRCGMVSVSPPNQSKAC